MQPIISIIMPVYNTGEILKNTVESILNQTFSNFELIIVDDGSSDHTGVVCDKFAENDNRIRVIHKTNEGACCARNLGIKESKGKYITFCDHDDIYAKNILEEEWKLINQREGIDIVSVGALHIYDDGTKLKFGKKYSIFNKIDLDKNIASIITSGVLGTVWNILYKKELVENIRFDEDLKKGHEDIIFNLKVIQRAKSLVSTDDILYYHFIRKSMSTSASFHPETIEALRRANNKISELCKNIMNKIDRNDYIKLQGEYIRVYATYLVHLDESFQQFKNKMDDLDFNSKKFHFYELCFCMNKDTISYYCLEHNKKQFLYWLIKINNKIKRKKI